MLHETGRPTETFPVVDSGWKVFHSSSSLWYFDWAKWIWRRGNCLSPWKVKICLVNLTHYPEKWDFLNNPCHFFFKITIYMRCGFQKHFDTWMHWNHAPINCQLSIKYHDLFWKNGCYFDKEYFLCRHITTCPLKWSWRLEYILMGYYRAFPGSNDEALWSRILGQKPMTPIIIIPIQFEFFSRFVLLVASSWSLEQLARTFLLICKICQLRYLKIYHLLLCSSKHKSILINWFNPPPLPCVKLEVSKDKFGINI